MVCKALQIPSIIHRKERVNNRANCSFDNKTGIWKDASETIIEPNKDISDLNETFMTLKTSLDQKDEEISRYKNGYDAIIFKNFLLLS